MAKLDNVLIYQWQAWRGFLISHLVADYCMVEASYEDDFSHLIRFITPNIRAVLLQINLSDCSDFPDKKRDLIKELEARNIMVLNKEVEDIRKTHLHQLLRAADLPCAKAANLGNKDEMLFVKSNLNWGGAVEKRLPEALHTRFIGSHSLHITQWDRYYKVKRSEVPSALWDDPSVVIERYISNSENSFYRVYCFGESLVVVKAHSHAVIKKISQHPDDRNFKIIRTSLLEGRSEGMLVGLPRKLITTLSTFIRFYPLAYFCLDILHDNQDYYIADLNLTPWSGLQAQTKGAVSFLTEGGQTFIRQGLQGSIRV